MTKQYYLAVDIGATSGRTVLGCYDGEKMEMQEWTRFRNPMIPMQGHLYWDLPALYNETLAALKRTADEGITLRSIGIDTWGCDVALFGNDGQLLALPYSYRDPHTEGAAQQLFKRISSKTVYERTGIQFMDFNTIFQLDTLRRERSSALSAVSTILFIPDALSYLLTGHAVMEYTVASTSQLLNPTQGDLDPKLLTIIGLNRTKFPPLVKPGTVVGALSRQVATVTGLEGTPVVAVAGHDTASAVAAIPESDPDYAYLSCGTWSLLGIETPHPIITPQSRRMNFTNEGGIDGTTRFLKNICGLWLMEQCRKEWTDVPENVNELNALCLTSTYEGLINPDHPSFAHPQSMTEAITHYCQDTQQATPETPADFLRCIFRSLALRYRQVTEMLALLSPHPIKRLHVIGGGSKNKHLMQMTADAMNMPVVCGPTEGTALGNLLIQARAAGNITTYTHLKQIAEASTTLTTYTPKQPAAMSNLYTHFMKIQTT